MPVKSKSRTFKPDDDFQTVHDWFTDQIDGAIEEVEYPGEPSTFTAPYTELVVKKRLVITITYDRDDKTE